MSVCPNSQLPRFERAMGGPSLHPVRGVGGSVLSPPHAWPSAGSSTPLPGPSLDHELERQSPTQVPGTLASVVSTPSPMSGGTGSPRGTKRGWEREIPAPARASQGSTVSPRPVPSWPSAIGMLAVLGGWQSWPGAEGQLCLPRTLTPDATRLDPELLRMWCREPLWSAGGSSLDWTRPCRAGWRPCPGRMQLPSTHAVVRAESGPLPQGCRERPPGAGGGQLPARGGLGTPSAVMAAASPPLGSTISPQSRSG